MTLDVRRPKIRKYLPTATGTEKLRRCVHQKPVIRTPSLFLLHSFVSTQPSNTKKGKGSIQYNASPETVSMICKLSESVDHLSVLLAVRKHVDDLPKQTHIEAQKATLHKYN